MTVKRSNHKNLCGVAKIYIESGVPVHAQLHLLLSLNTPHTGLVE